MRILVLNILKNLILAWILVNHENKHMGYYCYDSKWRWRGFLTNNFIVRESASDGNTDNLVEFGLIVFLG